MTLIEGLPIRRLASPYQRAQLYILQDGKCDLCGNELGAQFDIDHIQLYSKQGDTELWNLQALCKPCHLQKHRDQGS